MKTLLTDYTCSTQCPKSIYTPCMNIINIYISKRESTAPLRAQSIELTPLSPRTPGCTISTGQVWLFFQRRSGTRLVRKGATMASGWKASWAASMSSSPRATCSFTFRCWKKKTTNERTNERKIQRTNERTNERTGKVWCGPWRTRQKMYVLYMPIVVSMLLSNIL